MTTKPAWQEILKESGEGEKKKKKRPKATKTREDQRTASETPTVQVTQWH